MRRAQHWLVLSVLAVLLAITAISAAGPPDTPPGLARAIAAQEAHTNALLATPGVVGTAVGVGGNGAAVVLVLTEGPGVKGIAGKLDGVAVVTKVTGKIVALHHHAGHNKGGPGGDPPPSPSDCTSTTEKCRPALLGQSTGHPSITAGTIGALVTDGANVYALSNNHVYANENRAAIGDAVIQPGTFDGGSSPADDIGTLSDFEPIKFDGSDNTIDAAISLSSIANLGNATLSDGYSTPKTATIAASLNMRVKKYGRTTGETKGRVSAINVIVNVGYDSGVAKFVNQIIIEPGDFSAPGDSGSLIVVSGTGMNKADDRRPVGLLFAGSAFVTVANPIDAVLTRFNVTIDGN